MSELKYKRILLKVSGEALAGEKRRGLDFDIVNALCDSIKECVDMGVQIGLVIGAGNFWRGVKDGADKMQRSHGDAMGMLATVMNCIYVSEIFRSVGMKTNVLTPFECGSFTKLFSKEIQMYTFLIHLSAKMELYHKKPFCVMSKNTRGYIILTLFIGVRRANQCQTRKLSLLPKIWRLKYGFSQE